MWGWLVLLVCSFGPLGASCGIEVFSFWSNHNTVITFTCTITVLVGYDKVSMVEQIESTIHTDVQQTMSFSFYFFNASST